MGAALAEVDKALATLSSHFPAASQPTAGGAAAADGAGGAAAAAAAAAAPYGSSFGGFAPTPEITPAGAAGTAAAGATAAAVAPSGAYHGDDGLVESYLPEPQQVVAAVTPAVGVPEYEEPVVGTPMGTPVKLAEGIPAGDAGGGGGTSAPHTPLYQGVVTGTATAAAEGRPVVARGLPTYEAPDTVLRGAGGAAGAAGGSISGPTGGLSPQVLLGVPAAAVPASPTVHAGAAAPAPAPAAAYPSVAAAAAAVPAPVLPPSTPGAAALDALLLTEVEKLKRVNAALAGTLASYGHVTERLGSAATSLAAAAASTPTGASTARTLFPPTATSPAAGGAAAAAAGNVPSWYSYGYASNNEASVSPYPAISPAAAASAAAAAAQPTWTPPRSSLRHTAPLASPSPASPALATFTPAPATTTRVAGSTAATTYRGAGAAAASGNTGGGLYGEIRNMDLTMDAQLYDIRQQLLELRRDVALGRVATTAAAAPGGTPGYSPGSAAFAHTSTAVAAPNTFFSPRVGAGAPATSAAAAAAAAAPPPARSYGASAVEISRMKDEIADLRRQLSFDKAWYLHSLDGVVAGRSSMFADLQRRIDDLLAPRPFR